MDVYEYFVVFIHGLRFNDLSYKDFIICDLPTIPVILKSKIIPFNK